MKEQKFGQWRRQPNLHRSDRATSSGLSLTKPSSSLLQIYTASQRSFLFSLPLSFPLTNQSREANKIFDLQTNLVVIASFRPTHRSRRYQTHSPISPLSNPPAHLTSFRLTHQSVVLYLSLSLNLSLPLPLSRLMLIFRKTEFFLLCFFVDLVYIFRFPIIIFVWKMRKCERMCFLEDFQKHNQIP